jgi:hypothetical protein
MEGGCFQGLNFSPSQNWKKRTLVQSVQAVQANKHTS